MARKCKMPEFTSSEFNSDEGRLSAQEFEKSTEKEKPQFFDAIIVLGGGIRDPLWKEAQAKYPEGINPSGTQIKKSEGWMLPFDAKMRTIAAAQMYLEGLTKEIIFTGGQTATNRGIDVSEAQKMKEYAEHILSHAGIEKEKIDQVIILEDKATNTIENVANVCNIVDQDKEKYQNLAILSNEYHLDRAQKLLGKFDLEAESVSAEDKMTERSGKYQKVLNKFFESPKYQKKLAGERRWTAGLDNLPRYWFPQAMAVEDPERLTKIMESIYGPALAQRLGKKPILKSKEILQKTKRAIPAEKWGEDKL